MIESVGFADGFPGYCKICGSESLVDVSRPPGDSVCPRCGSLVWISHLTAYRDDREPLADCFISDLASNQKNEALLEMLSILGTSLDMTEEQIHDDAKAILKRESIGSTGIGRGAAVPHAKSYSVSRCSSILADSRNGIDFDSLDGEPVRRIWLLLSPWDRPGEHLRKLEGISRRIHALA